MPAEYETAIHQQTEKMDMQCYQHLAAGYRCLEFKFDDDEDFGNVLNHLIIQGPVIGAKFWF